MKKIFAIALILTMVIGVLSFAGCSNNTNTGSTSASTEASKETIVMATNAQFPPYEYYEGEVIVGIDAEIAQAIADDMGVNLEIVSIEFDSILTGVQTGKYDFGMAGMTVTDERKQAVDFSDTYATAKQVIIVKEDSSFTNFDDLVAAGAKAGVQIATTGDIYASDTVENGGLGAENVTEYNNGADAVAALVAGKVDCVIIDNEPAKSFVAVNEGLKILDSEYVEEQYAACFPKNSDLLAKFNASLKKLTDDGTVQKIVDKYINTDTTAETAASTEASSVAASASSTAE